jgi:hypothetical protein
MTMAETKKEPAGQEPSTQADPKAAAARQDTDTKRLAGFLTSILTQVQSQVQSNEPNPLEDNASALKAVDVFRKIVAALALQPCPVLNTLEANPDEFVDFGGGDTTLTWSSTGAQTVSISQKVVSTGAQTVLIDSGAPSGSQIVPVGETTEFTATAVHPCCSSAPKSKTVTVAGIG